MSELVHIRTAVLAAALAASAGCPRSETSPAPTDITIARPPPADADAWVPPTTHDAAPEQVMPIIRTASDVASNKGQRVNIEATLRRVPLHKGAASHPATALFLGDGTQIWVTYGEPPPGWETYVDKDVTVEAIIWTGPPPGSKQAVGGPHVSDWSEPAAR
jgi:hypothetical protein